MWLCWKINQKQLDEGKDVINFAPCVKLFNATGRGAWYLSELSPDNIGFGVCHIYEAELGYVSLDELNNSKAMIEKDKNFYVPGRTLMELKESLAA